MHIRVRVRRSRVIVMMRDRNIQRLQHVMQRSHVWLFDLLTLIAVMEAVRHHVAAVVRYAEILRRRQRDTLIISRGHTPSQRMFIHSMLMTWPPAQQTCMSWTGRDDVGDTLHCKCDRMLIASVNDWQPLKMYSKPARREVALHIPGDFVLYRMGAAYAQRKTGGSTVIYFSLNFYTVSTHRLNFFLYKF